MKSFRKRYDLNDYSTVASLLTKAESCHRAIQHVEAGVAYNKQAMATATFLFLDLIGYYPKSFAIGWATYSVDYIQMVHDDAATYLVFGLDGNRTTPKMSLFGDNHKDFSVVRLDEKSVETVVDTAFPKAQVNGGTDVTMDDKKPHLTHLTIREKYMQGNGSLAPVASGSATCSDLTIALMQATTRMIHAIITNAKLELVQKKEEARQVAKKAFLAKRYRMGPDTLEAQARAAYDLGKEKYGKRSWVPGGTITAKGDWRELLDRRQSASRFYRKPETLMYSFDEMKDIDKHILHALAGKVAGKWTWFDEHAKNSSDETDMWAKWSAKSPDPVVPKPEKPKLDMKKVFDEVLTKTRDDFYKAEGKTVKNILTWARTEAYLRKVYDLTK